MKCKFSFNFRRTELEISYAVIELKQFHRLSDVNPGQHSFLVRDSNAELKTCLQFWAYKNTICRIWSHNYPSITRKRSKRYIKLAELLPVIYLPHQDGGVPLSAFANGTTLVKLPACCPRCRFTAERQSRQDGNASLQSLV